MQGIIRFEDIDPFDIISDVIFAGYGGAGGDRSADGNYCGALKLLQRPIEVLE